MGFVMWWRDWPSGAVWRRSPRRIFSRRRMGLGRIEDLWRCSSRWACAGDVTWTSENCDTSR